MFDDDVPTANTGESTPPPVPVETPPPPPVETPQTPPTPPVVVKPPPDPIRERFSELAAQRREAEARAARLEGLVAQQSEQLRTALDAFSKAVVPPPPVVPDVVLARPLREEYTAPEEYETALIGWAGQQAAEKASVEIRRQQEKIENDRVERERAATQSAEETRQRERMTQIESAWNERVSAAQQKYPDFDEVARNPDLKIPAGSYVADAVVTREDGAEIAYYLGKHPEEAARLAAMVVPGQVYPLGSPFAGRPVYDAIAQSFEIGKIAAKLEVERNNNTVAPAAVPVNTLATPEPAPVIAPAPVVLPAPPTALTGASAIATMRPDAELSPEDYAARHQERIRKSLGLGNRRTLQ